MTCEDTAKAVKRATGWNFANVMNRCFGNTSIIFSGEAKEGGDLSFTATDEWVIANHPSRSGIDFDKLKISINHVENCHSPDCVEAKKRISMVAPYLRGKIPGGDAILLLTQFMAGGGAIVTNQQDDGGIVNELKPFFEWFAGEPHLWSQETSEK